MTPAASKLAAATAPGTVWGRWTVVRPAGRLRRGAWEQPRALVRCVCGVEKIVWAHDLAHGRSRGCRFARCRHEAALARLELLALEREAA